MGVGVEKTIRLDEFVRGVGKGEGGFFPFQ